jgi:hypothetical protein
VNSAVNAPVQCTSKTPKLTLNAAPILKYWSLSLLQMVTLFQAQAQAQAQQWQQHCFTEKGFYV